ncbi:metal ABC transporter substrate-binding protein [Sphaerisporangium dianthi]|uniref:Metal ABC transporter substrate-binding protein n=1 Tax=Sphaerisporangium dianthi TaxID=1436120 RepID=A0ABV9C9R5_9ACTN
MPFSSRYDHHARSTYPRRLTTSLSVFAGAAALLAATACSPTSSASTQGAGASGGPKVLAAFYPLEWLATRVGGPDTTVTGLTRPGVEPHDLELTPRQIADIQRADLVVYIKGVQPAVDEAVEQQAPDKAFDAASLVPVLSATGEEEHEERAGGGQAHEPVPYDPHLWLDPDRLATVAAELGKRLGQADGAHASAYTGRANTTAGELKALDEEFRKGLAQCSGRTIVTSHAAFGYLTNRYGLKQVGISGLDPDAEPSPARIAEVAATARREKVTTIFTEELLSPKVSAVLAKEIGATTAVLNPIESRPPSGDYLSAARENLSVLRTALGCS